MLSLSFYQKEKITRSLTNIPPELPSDVWIDYFWRALKNTTDRQQLYNMFVCLGHCRLK